MNKYSIISILLIVLVLLSISSTASMIIPANDKAKENAKAPENSPVIGNSWDLERVDFIHYARPEKAAKPPAADTCYKLLGVKWTSLPASYAINPNNLYGLSEEFVTGSISTAAETWDAATSKEILSNIYSLNYNAQYGIRDFQNAIVFGEYPDSNAIAVTSIWYSRRTKQIVEFDMIFNTKFAWGDSTTTPNVMDLQNIATHEFGHAVGLDDLYTTSCSAVTMYGYSSYGDMEKRTLEQPDITGLQKMYGA